MIWVHTYAVGKFRNREMKTIHRSEKSAIDMCSVLGGIVQAFIPVENLQVRADHAEWSDKTFGTPDKIGCVGPLKHLAKEAIEASENPGDLSEWADIQLLLWDAQRRAGVTDEQILSAIIEKMEVNRARDWPEPKDGEPRMHIK